jgi:hypothetical protein
LTDDLVKRLRDAWTEDGVSNEIDEDVLLIAADRIEELEAALREIADGARDVDKSYISLFHELQFEARAALGEKKND